MTIENKEKIESLKKRLTALGSILDLASKRSALEELEKIVGDEKLWDDPENAQSALKERASVKELIDEWEAVQTDLEEAQILAELAEEENDEESGREAYEKFSKLDMKLTELELKRMLGGKDDDTNAIVSINAGAGGTEAQDWADIVLRMLIRYAERKRYKVQMVEIQTGDEAGIKSATFIAQGPYAFGYTKSEAGVHRLVRISPFDSNKRRHTSFCSVFVSPEIEDDIEIEIDDKDLRVDTYRASGAGGQHVNKTDSAVRITHLPSGIVASCQNQRSQHQNRFTAMKILKARLYELERAKQQEKLDEIQSGKKEIGWGSQIRSYVLHPYRMIKDHRTGYETGNVDPVLDGDLDEFVKQYLFSSNGANSD